MIMLRFVFLRVYAKLLVNDVAGNSRRFFLGISVKVDCSQTNEARFKEAAQSTSVLLLCLYLLARKNILNTSRSNCVAHIIARNAI